ncbi:MAG: hypothetical protein ACI9RZ_002224, partial [Sphingobacteriales bacterium]
TLRSINTFKAIGGDKHAAILPVKRIQLMLFIN